MRVVVLCLLATAVFGAHQHQNFGLQQKLKTKNAVDQIIKLFVDMIQKLNAEKEAETTTHEKFVTWSESTMADANSTIREAQQESEAAQGLIEEATAKINKLEGQVQGHRDDIECWTGDRSAATAVRGMDNQDFQATLKDFNESIDALTRAIAVLKQQDYDREQAASLLQLPLPQTAKDAVEALVQGDDDLDAEYKKATAHQDPQASGYEFQSSKVVNMLKNLLKDFDQQRTDLQKAETESNHLYKMLMADTKQQIANANTNINQKTERIGKKKTTKGEQIARKKKADEQEASATRLYDDTDVALHHANEDYAARQEARADELAAAEEAKNTVANSAAAGNFFLQMSRTRNDDHITEVARFLEGQADETHSQALSALAVSVAAGGPFDKIKKMIEGMITKLIDQARAESEQKAWCDEQLGTNKQDREHCQQKINELSALIEKSDSAAKRLGKEAAAASKRIAKLASRREKLTEIREREKEENEQTIRDAQDASDMVDRATESLESMFSDLGGRAAAMIQVRRSAKPYEGSSEGLGSIMELLNVVKMDNENLKASTHDQEKKEQADYEEEMFQSEKESKVLTDDLEYKRGQKEQNEDNSRTAKSDRVDENRKLDKANNYYEKLKPPCVVPDVSHEERMANRAQEIESLQQALSILTGEEVTK